MEQVIETRTIPAWLVMRVAGRGKAPRWSREEEAMLRACWGKMPREELAAWISCVTRRQTGNPWAGRSVGALVNQARRIGLGAYQGDEGEMSLQRAARVADLPYWHAHKAAAAGEFATRRSGKQRYVTAGAWECWLLVYRERKKTQAEALCSIGEETISKQEAMALTGVGETQMTRYLTAGVIQAWKVPEGPHGRGYWRVSLESARKVAEARAAGRRHLRREVLSDNEEYARLRERMHAEIKRLREAGRTGNRDPLTHPRSVYHPGCFTVAQVASASGMKASRIYAAIEAGELKAMARKVRSRVRYAVEPGPAREFVARVCNNTEQKETIVDKKAETR